MKIFQIHNEYKFYGGEDAVVEHEKNLLTEYGHLVFQLKRSNKSEIINFIDKLKVAKNLSYSINSKALVNKEIQKLKPDIIHIHNIFPLWTVSVLDACLENNIPIVVTLHNFRTICARGDFFRKKEICEKCLDHNPYYSVLYGCYQNSHIKSLPVANMITYNQKRNIWGRKVNRFIALTNFTKKKFIQANFPEEKIRVKPNFILPNNIKKKEINKNLKKNCLYAGRLSQEKGITTLLKAWKEINFNLKVFGDGPLYHKINERQSNINFYGSRPNNEIIEEMQTAKFLVYPSENYENFPITILEAFYSGVLVLASSIGSIREIIKDRYNGILFSPGNVLDLRNKINWILSNPEECKTISENASKDFLTKYSKEENYKTLIKIYKEAIDNKKNELHFQNN